MKRYRIVVFASCMITLVSASYGQSAEKPDRDELKTELTAVEKGLWDAWKHNNVAAFHAVLDRVLDIERQLPALVPPGVDAGEADQPGDDEEHDCATAAQQPGGRLLCRAVSLGGPF